MGFHDHAGIYHAHRESIPVNLCAFVVVDANGDVGNLAAHGGKLASDSTPILRGDAAETQELSWATSGQEIIAAQIPLPADFQGKDDVLVVLRGYTGTTDANSYTVETGWDGGALVSDTATGSASATEHEVTARVAAADIPDGAKRLTLIITPAGTHTTDTQQLTACRVDYVPAVMS